MSIQIEGAGEALAAAVVTAEVAGGNRGAPPHGEAGDASDSTHAAHAAHAACANCGATLQGAFCHQCGQTAHIHRSMLHLVEELLHGLLHFETKAWRTLPMLLFKPGKLTRDFIDGHRVRYVSPLALLLFLIFMMFLVFSLTSSSTALQTTINPAQAAMVDKNIQEKREAIGTLEAQLAALPADDPGRRRIERAIGDRRLEISSMEQALVFMDPRKGAGNPETARVVARKASEAAARWFPWLGGSPALPTMERKLTHALENKELALYKIKGAAAKFAFLLVPISLPFLWLLFVRRRDVGMFDHAVFTLYSLSAMSVLMMAVALCGYVGLGGLAALLAVAVPPLHMFSQLRGTYAISRFSAAWRTVALLVIAGCSVLVYSLAIVLVSM